MGVIKTVQGSTDYPDLWSFKIIASEIDTDNTNMESVVRVECFLGRVSSSSFAAGDYNITFYAGDQDKTYEDLYINTGTIYAGGYASLGYYDFTIKHNSEPTTINIGGEFWSGVFSPHGGRASGTMTLTILHQHPNPTMSGVVELNQKLIDAEIGEHYFVSNLSKKSFPISGTTDGGTIDKYLLHNGNTNIESDSTPIIIDFASTPLFYEYSEQYKRNVAPFSIGIRDSFGLQAYFLYNYNYVIPYVKPNLIPTASDIKRNGQLTGKVKLNLTGTFYNGKIGSITNRINLSYKYWKIGSTEPTNYITIPTSAYTINDNNVTISNWEVTKDGTVITDVDKSSAYKFKIKIVDSFESTHEIELICSKGEWLMARFKDRVDFKKITVNNSNPFEHSNKEVQIGIYNGKPLYRKTILFNTTVNANQPLNVSHGVSNVEKIWVNNGQSFIYNDSAGSYSLPIVGYDGNFADTMYAIVNKTNIVLCSTGGWGTSWEKHVTIEYTKTTD